MALFDKASLFKAKIYSIDELEKIRNDIKAINKHAKNKAALKTLVRSLKENVSWPHAAELMRAVAKRKNLTRENLIQIYDFFVKRREPDIAASFLPEILKDLGRNESIFSNLRKPIALNNEASSLVKLEDQDLWNVGRVLLRQPSLLLRLPPVRAYVARRRRGEFVKDIYKLNAKDSEHSIENTVIHNLETMDRGADDGARTELLLGPLMALDVVRKKAPLLKVLTIGPRSEAEIFSIWAAGFSPDNVSGVDLISYTPLISQGDMHSLPFDESEFDIVIAGWVLAYSNNNALAAKEIMRVAKPGAYLAVGCAYSPVGRKDRAVTGTNVNPTRFSKVEDITCLFESRLDRVMFYGEPAIEAEKSTGAKQVTTVIRLK